MWFWIIIAVVGVFFGLIVFRGAPYVPSHRRQIERAFDELYPIGKKDTVVDVGSGDGIVLRQASRRGAKAVGYELNPILVAISRFLSRGDNRTHVYLRDFWLTPVPADTTLVYGFLVERDIEKIVKKLQYDANRLKRPLYFISYGASAASHLPIRQLGAHHLYVFEPLQADKP